jgi:hypothetical protein
MEPESGDGKDPSSSPSHGAEEDSDLFKTNGTTPMEREYSFLTPREDANDGTSLQQNKFEVVIVGGALQTGLRDVCPDYSNTWKGEVRAVTQTQIDAFENSTELELRAVLAEVAKDITLRR